jgi:hypothetical protein
MGLTMASRVPGELRAEGPPTFLHRYGPLLGALAIILVLAVIWLPAPTFGDTWLFSLGAKEISRGSVLYRDWFDFKQPGIFLMYLIGGGIFGFTSLGLQLFGLVYQLISAAILGLWALRVFPNRWLAALFPLLAIGMMYVTASQWSEYLLLEGMIGIVIFGSLVLGDPSRPWRYPPAMYFASGLLGAVVGLIKETYIPIVIAFWVIGALRVAKPRRRYLGAIAFGAAVPLFAFAIWMVATGSTGDVWYAFVTLPVSISRSSHEARSLGTLAEGFRRFAYLFAPVIALALIGTWRLLQRKRSYVEVSMLSWAVLGGILQFTQLWSGYHLYLLYIPFAYLAVLGTDVVARWWTAQRATGRLGPRAAAVGVLAILCIGSVVNLGRYFGTLASHGFALSAADRDAFRMAIDENTWSMTKEAGVIDQIDPGGGDNFFAWANPYIFFVSHRLQHGWMNGTAPEQLPPSAWDDWIKSLDTDPPRVIFVQNEWFRDKVMSHSPKAWQAIQDRYTVAHESPIGTWFVLKSPAAGSGTG